MIERLAGMKRLKHHDTFKKIWKLLKAKCNLKEAVIDAKGWVAQSRKRCFVTGIHKDHQCRKLKLSPPPEFDDRKIWARVFQNETKATLPLQTKQSGQRSCNNCARHQSLVKTAILKETCNQTPIQDLIVDIGASEAYSNNGINCFPCLTRTRCKATAF